MQKVNRKNGMADGFGMAGLEDAVKESFETANAYVQEGYDAARDAVAEAVQPLNWKTVAAVALGVAAVAGLIVLACRRPQRSLLQRGLHEGARVAAMIPGGWHRAQDRVRDLAEESRSESLGLWNKRPRVHVEFR